MEIDQTSHTSHILTAVVMTLASSTRADILCVHDDNSRGPGRGTAEDPYCSIQAAIDDAVDTDEIVVAPGTYLETIDFLGKAITLRSSGGPEVTTIDGGGLLSGSVVICQSGEGPTTVLEGFTVTGGHDFGNGGGGMRNDNASPTIIGCIFSDNIADASLNGRGGGMYNKGGNPTVVGCLFTGNIAVGMNAGSGGGMYNENGIPTVINCTFSGNSAPLSLGAGGGMYNNNCNAVVVNCHFEGNSAVDGGGMLNNFSAPTMTNCTFTGNSIGVLNFFGDAVFTNCVLWANPFGEIIDWSSVSTVTYSDVQGGWPGVGNIDADPLFVAPSDCCAPHGGTGCDEPSCELAVCDVDPLCCDLVWGSFCAGLAATLCPSCPSDISLSPGSPCIDAGDNNAVPENITTDLDGNPRFLDVPETPDTGNGDPPVVDMGAYESLGGGCLALTGQEVVCHPDGTTFTLEIEGVSVCTGDMVMSTFTASGGAVGEDLCFTMLIDDDQGGFCCSSQVCVPVPDCSEALADLDGDGVVGVMDLMLLLSQYGPCPGGCWADMNHDGMVGVTDLLLVLGNWG